ncbi:MAG TPA: TOMM precursor leader peptide-binding protein, partial [Polyangiaceae bacterium]|nr:TOMM precursor leader peptide-binding protein [Polyangiaceae bacterium]
MVVQPLQPNDVLAFRPGLCVEVFDDQTVLLITERERFVSTGASTGTVCRLVDGQRTVQEIIAAARDEVPEPEALYALGLLAARGHLVADTAGLDPEVAAFWLGHGLDPRSAVDALARTPVSVRAIGDTGTLPCFLEALEYAGVRVDPSAAVQVVVTDDYLRPELEALNSAALRGGAPWFLVQVVGLEPLIGPEFRPGLGPCWECLAFWLRNNRPVEEFIRLRRSLPARPPPRARSSASVRAACALGALVISRTLAQGGASDVSPLHARLLVVDPSQGTTTPHAVIARPQCRACGDPQLMTAIGQRAINLQSVAKTVRAEGGARRKSAQQTYRELEHLVSPLTGPVTHLHPWPERHTEQRPVYVSGYLVCPQPGLPRSNAFDRGCAGKGRSNDQAKVSALCEALERFSCVHRGDEARVRASAVDLGRAAIRPDSLLLFSEAQLRSRDLHPSQLEDPRRWIPVSLPETTSIDWAPAWSLHHQERRYVPYTHCYTEVPSESGTAYCRHTGNGVAAGTCVEEALLQAVLELCERDAAAVWWYNRVARPAIDLSSF